MTRPTVGALFAGYGGIELAVHDVLDAEPAWFSEFDDAPSKILAHRWPGVPNLGDVTKVKWSPDCPACGAFTRVGRFVGVAVDYVCSGCGEHHPLTLRDQQQRELGIVIAEPVDIVGGGSPCQDVSSAGKRAGMRAGTRSGLWASMCDAIDIIRPSLVIWENVRGALSASAASASDLVDGPGPLGDRDGGYLRALGRVLGDLADIGYDAAWVGLRAADVGAPHGRFRIFVLAWPAAHTDCPAWGERGFAAGGKEEGRRAWTDAGGSDRASLALLPTPVVNDMGAGKAVDAWDAWTASMQAKHGNGNGHGASLSIEALRMLPTPSVADATGGHASRSGARSNELLLPGLVRTLLPTPTSTDYKASGASYPSTATHQQGTTLTDATVRQPADFGQYAPAIARWEALTRPAPSPTEPTGKGGAQRLSPRFVEWMQGLPDGWVTGVPGITRNDMLKALGNGVVPQQCAAAVRHLLTIRAAHMAKAAVA